MGYQYIDFDAAAALAAAAECFAAARGLHAVAGHVRVVVTQLRVAWDGRAFYVFGARAGVLTSQLDAAAGELHAAGEAWLAGIAEAEREEAHRRREHEAAEERERQEREQVPL